jgi:serine/threonine protein kinase
MSMVSHRDHPDINSANSIGHWTGGSNSITIPKISLEQRISAVEGQEKELFLDFVRSMLRWQPDDRKSATELLKHQWMADIT